MAATREDINIWIETAKSTNIPYIISVCDTFEYDDYPVYCKNKKMLLEKYKEYSVKSMQIINEIIRINSDGTVNENLSILNA